MSDAIPSRAAMLDALERTYWNLRSMSAGKPVRDLAEAFAEAESVLKAAGRMDGRSEPRMNDEEAKGIAMGLFIEQCVREGRLDLIPAGEFIPPRWMVEDDDDD